MVRVIRTYRPDVVINNWAGARGGHGHHQASGLLTPRAVEAAADATRFPEQIAEGLPAWKTEMTLGLARFGSEPKDGWRVPYEQISPILGKSYGELGLEGFQNHRTQGITVFLNSPFLRRPIYLLPPEGKAFKPEILARSLINLPGVSPEQNARLAQADRELAAAEAAAQTLDWPEAVRRLAEAGRAVRAVRDQLTPVTGQGNANLLWQVERVLERIHHALACAAALRIIAQADRATLVAGESFSVRVDVRRRANVPLELSGPTLALPRGWTVTKEVPEEGGGVRFTVSVPKNASTPHAAGDWMLPWPTPLVAARVHVRIGTYEFNADAPVVSQRASSTRVDTYPLELVPAVTLALEPRQFILPENRPPHALELLARVHYYGTSAAKVALGLDVPPGWKTQTPAPIEFAGAGDQLVKFGVTPPAKSASGDYPLQAWAAVDGEKFRTSLEPLPTLPRRLWSEPATATVCVFDVSVPENLRVGYIAAENDPIPDALRQLGIHVELLDPVQLAFGDLKRFDAIAIGIRAYELRPDLVRSNQRLLDYAAAGGTLVVQYQRDFVWNSLKPAPFPATIGQPTLRTSDETVPVRFLVPASPLLNFPNRIAEADFKGWVQERGLYYWGEWDSRYQAVLAMHDPGEQDANGSLVTARVGKGTYIYTGLAFFRQLPEGVPGAYRLFVNLLSQSRATR
jgi:hypothetical protein